MGRRNFEEKAYLHIHYHELANMPAYKDYMYQIASIRNSLRNQLEIGVLDNHGNNRDDELRAAILVCNTILSYPLSLQASYDRDAKKLEEMAAKNTSNGKGTLGSLIAN